VKNATGDSLFVLFEPDSAAGSENGLGITRENLSGSRYFNSGIGTDATGKPGGAVL